MSIQPEAHSISVLLAEFSSKPYEVSGCIEPSFIIVTPNADVYTGSWIHIIMMINQLTYIIWMNNVTNFT